MYTALRRKRGPMLQECKWYYDRHLLDYPCHPRPKLALGRKLISCALRVFYSGLICSSLALFRYFFFCVYKGRRYNESEYKQSVTSDKMTGFGTLAVRSGLPRDSTTGALVEPVNPHLALNEAVRT